MIAIIDYDAGNIKSVEKAVAYLGRDCVLTGDAGQILAADHVILPGVGAFGDAMKRLDASGLSDTIRRVCREGIPFLGICLGLQLLFDSSEESPGVKGLGIFGGSVRRFPSSSGLKVPNIGWNSLEYVNKSRILEGVDEGSFVYFVHSYYADPEDRGIVTSEIDYGVKAVASVESDNVFACQFHPEKSSDNGLKILENFLNVQ